MIEAPDWERLKKALAVEAKHGFSNIVGKQPFSEFLQDQFSQPPADLTPDERCQWQKFEQEFASYPDLNFALRQQLVTQARQYIHSCQQAWGNGAGGKVQCGQQSKIELGSISREESAESVSIDQPLVKLKGVGFRNGRLLELLDLLTVRDLLLYYPRDYINYARQVPIDELQPGETVTIVGEVKRVSCFSSPRNKKLTILDLLMKDSTGQIKVSRFFAGNYFSNKSWQEKTKRSYPVGALVAASGLVKKKKYGLTLDKPELEVLEEENNNGIESLNVGRLLPVYALTEGVTAAVVRRAVMIALPAAQNLEDPLPDPLRKQYDLLELQEAIASIHFPDDEEVLRTAQRRLIFDEFLYLQLGFLQRRDQQKQDRTGIKIKKTAKGKLIDKFYKLLPFQLTGAQNRVIDEILKDLKSTTPMNRLVQGDVGAGKTVVAVVAILAAIQSGYQAALMAPTEVLAEQHYRKLLGWFKLLKLPVELLTGSTKTAKRREIHAQLETGELPLLVGTHALIQDTVNFHRLGLVVIDEQHRFGVGQRALLLQKGEAPHVLTMTATPIPRTMALTIHGDLDVSQIDELPPGRKPIQTTVLSSRQRKKAYNLMRQEIAQGRQVYIVLPLIEESEKLDLRSAVEEHKRLSKTVFPEYNVCLLHGRMSSAEKEESINNFRDKKTQIIVSTTVIEVGVDVPNATVMMIENAERFGLSQLHQLRGRVGRGDCKSYCLLIAGSQTDDARQRLNVLEKSQDGFFIAEMDMRLRGPGQVLGTRQSGLPDFALASLVEDEDVLVLARDAAENTMLQDETLNSFPLLKAELERRYQRVMGGTMMT
ncbi:MAG: ATP-dependent DNA helicase RecG [Hormoscilla sp. GM102CHS1]|nr:ATP-dependent DNA helicase RecG [Hormoscilla sp. GM102CHS1]